MYGVTPQNRNKFSTEEGQPLYTLVTRHASGFRGSIVQTIQQLSLRSTYVTYDDVSLTMTAKPPGEAYEALVSFLDDTVPSWRASLARDMVKAIRQDGEVRGTLINLAY